MASMAIASFWASMASWSTPTVLFCVVNLVIATIFIASNFKSPNHQSKLARSPSLLERVKSVNLSSFYYATGESHQEHGVQYESNRYNSTSQPSLLQRVKSIDFSFSSFYTAPGDQFHDEHQQESEQIHHESPTQIARVPSLLERVRSIKFSTKSEQPDNSIDDPARGNSLFDRVKSFKLSSSLNSDHDSGDTSSSQSQRSDMTHDPNQDPVSDHTVTGNTSKYSGVTQGKKSLTNITKSRSERRVVEPDDGEEDVDRRRPATMKASDRVHDSSVDAKADDFIKRFKQQLKLQRIDSLQRFREMLNRGTSSGGNK